MARGKMSLRRYFGASSLFCRSPPTERSHMHHHDPKHRYFERLMTRPQHNRLGISAAARIVSHSVGSDSPAAAAERMLSASPYPAVRQLKCSYRDGELVIAGHVASFYLKQLAQIMVQKLDGVERISNIVEVT
jgi:hypothetical protein